MSSINTLWLKKSTLETLLNTINKSGKDGVELAVTLRDEANKYGQNVSAHVSQNVGEQNKPKFYVGNGNTVWSDGKITVHKKKSTGYKDYGANEDLTDNLPF